MSDISFYADGIHSVVSAVGFYSEGIHSVEKMRGFNPVREETMTNTPHTAPNPITPRSGGRPIIGLLAGIILLIVLLAIGILPKLRQKSELSASAQEAGTGLLPVEFVTPYPAPDNNEVVLPGTIQAIEEATVQARTSGYVRKRYVDIGSRVKRGEVLAEIETPEVDQQLMQAQADTAKAQASVGQSQADIQRLRVGVLQSQSEVKRFEANLRQAQAAEKRAEAKLLQSKAAEATARAKIQQAQEAIDQRKADLAQNQAQLTIAEKTLTRWQTLSKSGAVAQQDVDEKQSIFDARKANIAASQAAIRSAQADLLAAQSNAEASKADIEASQSDLDAAKSSIKGAQAALRSSQTNVRASESSVLVGQASERAMQAGVRSSSASANRVATLQSFKKVVAPFDGVITARNVDTGSLVKADNISTGATDASGSGLFAMARTDMLRIQISVPQTYVANIHDGMVAQVLVREFPGRVFNGTVKRISGALASSTRTLLTEVQLPNTEKSLIPGMYANVKFVLPHAKSGLRIPANTLLVNADGPQVATVTAEGTVHLVKVTIGRDYGPELDIASGLVGNEQLITNPLDSLQEDQKVDAKKAAPPEPKPAAPGGH